jgi:hypothetical protein
MVKNHTADSFDGGRAPSIVCEEELRRSFEMRLSTYVEERARSADDDARALTQAIMALTTNND